MFGFKKKMKPFPGYTHKVGGFKEQDRVATLLNWALADTGANVVFCHDTSLLAVFRFRGPDTESSTKIELTQYNAQLNNIIKSLGTGYVLYFDAQRNIANGYDRSKIDNPLVQMMDDERADYYASNQHFESSYYLCFYQEPPALLKHKITDAFYETGEDGLDSPDTNLKVYLDYLGKFLSTADRLENLFSSCLADLHRLDATELVTYLHNTCSPSRHLVMPNPERPLSDYLYEAPDLVAGSEMRVGSKFVKNITISSTFPPFSYPGLFDAFNKLDVEYRWVSRFICLSKVDSQKVIEEEQKQYSQTSKSILTYVREAITKERSEEIDESALVDRDDAAQALLELNSDLISYGYYSMTISVMDDDRERCKDKANRFLDIIQTLGFTAFFETTNNLEAWWGSLPGHYRANIRQYLVSSLNFCHFCPATAVWPGDVRNEHLKGPVLLYTDTTGFTPFRLSLHVGEVGHTMIVGPSGSGKSVLLNTLEAHFLKYPESKVFIFDKAASSRALTLAVGGNFYNLAAEGNGELSFQPLRNVDDERECVWAKEWLVAYLKGKELPVGPAEENKVWQALLSLRNFSPELRTISLFSKLTQDDPIREALIPLTMAGSYGRMFDNNVDFSGRGRWQVYEMEALMNTPAIVPPTLDYLFHRIDLSLKDTTGPAMIVMDECWLFMDNPAFRDKLREYLKDMRKKNTSIVIATQNLADIASKQDLFSTVNQECQSKIFLPNVNAVNQQNQELYKLFGCNDRQIELISQMTPKQDYYYTRSSGEHGNGHRVFRLALRPIEIPFVTSTAKSDQLAMNQILAAHDKKDFIYEWLQYKGFDAEWEKFSSDYLHLKSQEGAFN